MSVITHPLGEIADVYVGVPTLQSDIREGGRSGNVLSVRALTGNGINPDELMQADLEKLHSQGRDLDKYRAIAGDVLVSARSTILKTAIVPKELDGILINATLIGIRCRNALDPQLLLAYLRHPDGQAAVMSMAQSATTQMNITVSAVSKVRIPLPPVEEQRRIVEILDAAETAYSTAIEAAESRRAIARRIVFDCMLANIQNI